MYKVACYCLHKAIYMENELCFPVFILIIYCAVYHVPLSYDKSVATIAVGQGNNNAKQPIMGNSTRKV